MHKRMDAASCMAVFKQSLALSKAKAAQRKTARADMQRYGSAGEQIAASLGRGPQTEFRGQRRRRLNFARPLRARGVLNANIPNEFLTSYRSRQGRAT